jgi:hypothetical protein
MGWHPSLALHHNQLWKTLRMASPFPRFGQYHFEEQKALVQTEIIGKIKHVDVNKHADLGTFK